ncbi:Cd2+/Zn2+-exporting ATPase [Carboxydocella thermautotrophica]|nr:Cd2+/Zn2+-exporting ATPase [Carboxydocella thermautotrophica]
MNKGLLAKQHAQKVLLLQGLSCANCAAKIEEKVRNLDGVRAATLDFVAQRLTIEVENQEETDRIVTEAARIAQQIEAGLEVREEEKGLPEEQLLTAVKKGELLRLGIGALVYLLALVLKMPTGLELLLFLLAYGLVGGEIVLKAMKNIGRGQVFDENFLMTIATLGAFALREYPEAVAVMLFYQVGELLQDMAVQRSRRSIQAVLAIRPDSANLLLGQEVKRVKPEEVPVGAFILVKAGEKIPLDGRIVLGSSTVDTSALTGEALPRTVREGDEVLAGFINQNGLLTIEVTRAYEESAVARILELVQSAATQKAPTENFITTFARYYTPAVVLAAAAIALIPPLTFSTAGFSLWLYRALVFLVVSCPCALVVSIPLGFFGGLGAAARRGILVKGGNYLEALSKLEAVVFDKTGTLTQGVFQVVEVVPAGKWSREEILAYAALAESFSNHPLARSVLAAWGQPVEQVLVSEYEEISGQGVKAVVQGTRVIAGKRQLLETEGIAVPVTEVEGTVIWLALAGEYAGYIRLADQLKPDAKQAINSLRQLGIRRLVMLTGDSQAAARQVAEQLGITEVKAELLPQDKVVWLEKIEQEKTAQGKVAFVGDGINDAPVLARADIGIAMGGLGADAAIEAADVVLMRDEPVQLVEAVQIARRTKQIVWQNIALAFGVKGMVLLLGAGGLATMWEAVFADVGVALLAVLNALRILQSQRLPDRDPC